MTDRGTIKSEIQALADRGNVTLVEWKALRLNTAERRLLYPKLTNEAFAWTVDIALANCNREPQHMSYEDAIVHLYMPELLLRFRKALGLGYVEVDEPPSDVL